MEELEIIRYDEDGYKAMVFFENWRVAFLRYAEHFDKAGVKKLERHLLTDEVFVLLTGEASLIIGEEKKMVHMEKCKIYNVKKAVWHAIYVSKDAQVLIVENADTGKQNTEYREIEPICET